MRYCDALAVWWRLRAERRAILDELMHPDAWQIHPDDIGTMLARLRFLNRVTFPWPWRRDD